MCVFTEKDVNRTDRTNKFYEGLENPGLILLHDILMTYCMYDFDLGEHVVLECTAEELDISVQKTNLHL